MRNKLIIVRRACDDWDGAFADWPDDSVQFYRDCKDGRIWKGRIHFEVDEGPEDLDRHHDPDYVLEKKLESAAFSILYDAGPEDAAFHSGARFTGLEVHDLLQQESIALNSIFKHNESGRCHRVVRDARGHLALEPPHEVG